jgi:hypothetical protein
MPLVDYKCPRCKAVKIDQFVPRDHTQICECGETMEKLIAQDVCVAPIQNNGASFRSRYSGYRRTTKKSTSS